MDARAELEPYAASREVVTDRAGIGYRSGETVELWHHPRVTAPYRRERLIEAGAGPVRAGESFVCVDVIGRDAELH